MWISSWICADLTSWAKATASLHASNLLVLRTMMQSNFQGFCMHHNLESVISREKRNAFVHSGTVNAQSRTAFESEATGLECHSNGIERRPLQANECAKPKPLLPKDKAIPLSIQRQPQPSAWSQSQFPPVCFTHQAYKHPVPNALWRRHWSSTSSTSVMERMEATYFSLARLGWKQGNRSSIHALLGKSVCRRRPSSQFRACLAKLLLKSIVWRCVRSQCTYGDGNKFHD